MIAYLATYDLKRTMPDPYGPFLSAAGRHGWYTWIFDDSSGRPYKLPNTTIQGTFADYGAAARAFDSALQEAALQIGRDITVEKYIIAERGGARFYSDVVLPKPRIQTIGLGL
jgi:hypothetical protein